MEWIFKSMPIELLVLLLQTALIKYGNKLKDKDDNEVGTDDAAGNIFIAIAPVIPAFISGSESLRRKVLKSLYNVIGNYLGYPQHE